MPTEDKLRQLRKERNLTQQQLAENLGATDGHYQMEEKQSQTTSHYPCQAGRGFEVPIEELTVDNGSLRLDMVIPDLEIPTQFQAVSQFSEEERNALNIRMRNLLTG